MQNFPNLFPMFQISPNDTCNLFCYYPERLGKITEKVAHSCWEMFIHKRMLGSYSEYWGVCLIIISIFHYENPNCPCKHWNLAYIYINKFNGLYFEPNMYLLEVLFRIFIWIGRIISCESLWNHYSDTLLCIVTGKTNKM